MKPQLLLRSAIQFYSKPSRKQRPYSTVTTEFNIAGERNRVWSTNINTFDGVPELEVKNEGIPQPITSMQWPPYPSDVDKHAFVDIKSVAG
ncbi:hypothetical protein HID58_083768 [Brassica napus]|uniref:Uncharacterized protein n=1 Tax=Brassica napus TaxID=3708 RepID=A0ABQ7YEG7_BRANA|nr:hypothetical protein HID58_083768 [Brassica napus]